MTEKTYQGPIFALLIFLVVGAALAGTPGANTEPEYIQIDDQCSNEGIDNNNDGDLDFIEDIQCNEFPYSNGGGELGTQQGSYDVNANYQPYYDLTVDYVRDFVAKQCGGNLAGCIGTNFQNEVQFYCFFSDNVMSQRFDRTFDKFFNVMGMLPDDGSINTFNSVCRTIGQAPTLLPTIEYQASTPIPSNPGGSGGGK